MNGVERIAAERQRQMDLEGWTPEHDDEHDRGELARAAVRYAAQAVHQGGVATGLGAGAWWPWDESWWKPAKDPIRNLEKAGALIAAEIDRLLRKRDADLEQRLDDMGVQ